MRGAAIDGEAATATQGLGAGAASQRSFDDYGAKAPAPAPVVAADENPSVALLRMLDVPLNPGDPANAGVVAAMSQVQYMLRYNREARIREAWPEDVAKFEASVAVLNQALAGRNVPPVEVEKVEAVYRKHLLDVKEKKQ